jgi:hypothetical protein
MPTRGFVIRRISAALATLLVCSLVVAPVSRAQAQPAPALPTAEPAAPSQSPSAPPFPIATDDALMGVAGRSAGDDAELIEQQVRQNEELVANSRPSLTWGGYIDAGFFVPQGNGAGYVQDYGHARFNYAPYTNYSWVFLGDILAPAVNSRGEVADLGDAPGVDRFDSINSRGSPGFIINEVNLRLVARPASNAIITGSVNLMPRTGSNFALGDFFDVDLAQLEWLPTDSQRTSLFFGKMESVLGHEYRFRKSDRRFGVTPSLIARYTTGTALGAKVRSKFGQDDWFVVAAAITNGSNTTEQFHFYDEVDSNAGKTLSGRISARLPLPFEIELAISGSYGAQDRTTSNDHPMWFFGPDLLATLGPVDLKAAWLKGKAEGDPTQGVYELYLHGGGYLELDAMLNGSWGLLGRAEYRDAFVGLGSERAYLTKSWRATVGGRWVASRWAVVKAEYLRNGEYGHIPNVRNDVFTTDVVLSY